MFESHWVPLSYGLVPHLSKKFSKLLRQQSGDEKLFSFRDYFIISLLFFPWHGLLHYFFLFNSSLFIHSFIYSFFLSFFLINSFYMFLSSPLFFLFLLFFFFSFPLLNITISLSYFHFLFVIHFHSYIYVSLFFLPSFLPSFAHSFFIRHLSFFFTHYLYLSLFFFLSSCLFFLSFFFLSFWSFSFIFLIYFDTFKLSWYFPILT